MVAASALLIRSLAASSLNRALVSSMSPPCRSFSAARSAASCCCSIQAGAWQARAVTIGVAARRRGPRRLAAHRPASCIAGRTTDATPVEDAVRQKSTALRSLPTRRPPVTSITPFTYRLHVPAEIPRVNANSTKFTSPFCNSSNVNGFFGLRKRTLRMCITLRVNGDSSTPNLRLRSRILAGA